MGRNLYLASIAVALLAAACSGGGGDAASRPAPSSGSSPGSSTPQASTSPDVHVDGPVFVDAAGNDGRAAGRGRAHARPRHLPAGPRPGRELRAPGHHLERLRADRPGGWRAPLGPGAAGRARRRDRVLPRARHPGAARPASVRLVAVLRHAAARRPCQRHPAMGLPRPPFPADGGRPRAGAGGHVHRPARHPAVLGLRGDAGPALPRDAERGRLRDPERAAAGQPAPAHLGDPAHRPLAGAGRRRRPRGRPGARDRVHAAAAHRRAGRAADPARAPGQDRPRRARLLRRHRQALPHHPPGRSLPGHPRQPGQLPGAGGLDRPHLGHPADRGRVGCVPGGARGRPLSAADGDPVPAGRRQLVALEPRP